MEDKQPVTGRGRSWLILPAYVASFPDAADVPACPTCKTAKFAAAMVDEFDGTTACVSCENGHAWRPNELVRLSVMDASLAEDYSGKAAGHALNAWIHEFWTETAGSTDRALAILAGTMLDEVLEVLISAMAFDERLASDRLLKPDRPLGSFGARIDACYLFGLISEMEWRALRIVKDIRNDFAHKLENLSFKDASMVDRAGEVIKVIRLRGPSEADGRKVFEVAISALWTSLIGKTSLVTRVHRMPFEPSFGMTAHHLGGGPPASAPEQGSPAA